MRLRFPFSSRNTNDSVSHEPVNKKRTKVYWNKRIIKVVDASECPHVTSFQAKAGRFFWSVVVDKVCLLWSRCYNTICFAYAPWTLPRMEALLIEDKQAQIYKPACRMPTLFKDFVLIADPNFSLAVLKHQRNRTDEDALVKGGFVFESISKVLGQGNVISAPVGEHKKMRDFLRPFLTKEYVENYLPELEKQTQRLIKKWEEQSKKMAVNVTEDILSFTSEAISRNLLGFVGDHQKISQAVEVMSDMTMRVVRSAPTKEIEKKFSKSKEFIAQCAQDVLEKSKDKNLITEAKEAGFTEEKILSIAIATFFGGQETTASALTYGIYLLAKYPQWQERLYLEWCRSQQTKVSLKEFINLEDTDLQRFIRETLRIHPPSYMQSRQAAKNLMFDDSFYVSRGDLLTPCPYFSNRDSRRWGEDAHQFNPDRYLEEGFDKKTGPIMTFSMGPNKCMGEYFAMQEIALVLLRLVENFSWYAEDKDLKQCPGLMLKTHKDVKIYFHKRLPSL